MEITIDDLIGYVASEKDKAVKYQASTDHLGHKLWEMSNYAGASAARYFGISHADVDDYRAQQSQLELDFGSNIATEVTQVYNNEGTKVINVPIGTDLSNYRLYTYNKFSEEMYKRFTHDD